MTKKIKILIADENRDYVKNMKECFTSDEKVEEVIVAGNGEDAVILAKRNTPDIVVLDTILSAKDGYSVIEEIKKAGVKCKFLVASGLSSETFVQKAMALGVEYYMIKPVLPEIVLKRIKDIFSYEEIVKLNEEVSRHAIESEKKNNEEMKKAKSQRMIEEKITNIFITVGIPPHIKGYQFLREAIKIAIEKPEVINSITKSLYPSIAERYSTSASKVERAIRHAIEVAWNRGKIENLNTIFGVNAYSEKDKPTNGEFIALVADKMLLEGWSIVTV